MIFSKISDQYKNFNFKFAWSLLKKGAQNAKNHSVTTYIKSTLYLPKDWYNVLREFTIFSQSKGHKIFSNFGGDGSLLRSFQIKNDDTQIIEKNSNNKELNDELRKILYKYDSCRANAGVIIMKDSQTLCEYYSKGNGRATLRTSMSIAKSITAILMGIALDNGFYESTDLKVKEVLKDFDGTPYGECTIQNLLDMKSGMKFYEDFDYPFPDIGLIILAVTRRYNPMSVIEAIKLITKQYEPGEVYSYKSADTQVLGLVLAELIRSKYQCTEKGYNKFAHYVSEKLWKPLGAEYAATWCIDKEGNPLTFAFFNASLRDYAKVGLLLANKGKIGEKQIVSESWVAKLVKPLQYTKEIPKSFGRRAGYNNHIWVLTEDAQLMSFVGIWGQYVGIDLENNAVYCKFATDRNFMKNDPEIVDWMKDIRKYLKNESVAV